MEDLVRCGIECGLGEVQQAGEADDEAVDFAEGGETEDFCGIVAVRYMLGDGKGWKWR